MRATVQVVDTASARNQEKFGKVMSVQHRPASRRKARKGDVVVSSSARKSGKNQAPHQLGVAKGQHSARRAWVLALIW
jgi:hypothetical protein